jgi:hypothetical protein
MRQDQESVADHVPSSLHPGQNDYDNGRQGKRGFFEIENERPGRYFDE